MALQFQDIPIALVEGQDGSSDAALIQPPNLLKVQMGEFADRANVRVADGLTNLPVTSMAGETAVSDVNPSTRRLLTHKDELLLETYQGMYRQQVGGSFALAASSQNRMRSTLRCMRAGVSSIADAEASQTQDWSTGITPQVGLWGVDAAQTGDYTCTVWCERFGTVGPEYQVGWQVRHKTSDAVVGRGAFGVVGSNSREPRVVTFGGLFYIFALVDGDIGRIILDPASTQNVASTFTKITAVANYNQMDVALSPTHFCISVTSTAPLVRNLIFTQAAPTVLVGGPSVAIPASATHVGNTYIDTGGLGINQGFVAFYVCTGTLQTLRWYVTSPAGVGAGPALQAGFTPSLIRVFPLKENTGTATLWPVLADSFIGATPDGNNIVGLSYDATAGATGAMATAATASIVVNEHIVMGQPVSVSGATYAGETQVQGLWLPVQFASAAQPTFQVLDIALALGRTLRGNSTPAAFSVLRVFDAGDVYASSYTAFNTGRICTSLLVPSSNGLAAYIWCAKFTPNITNATDLGQNPTNLQRNTLSYADPIEKIEFADLTYMAGGTPLVYDGQNVFEEGFTFAPEAISVTPAGAGGPLSAGVYSIVFVYEWFDGQGNRWQSQVSPPVAFTAALANTYTAVVRVLRTSLKSGVQIVPYRTQAGLTVYRRDSPLGGAAVPLTDVALASSEPLYTGGVINFVGTQSNNALPGVKNFSVHQNRLIAVGGEFERGFFYSKERSLRFPAEFNRASGFGQAPEVTGRVAAASSFDDKLVLLAENGLSVLFGQGPNALWAQNGFTAPVRIQAAEGIRFDSPQVAEVADGVWYVTSTGPRLLTRGLSTAEGPNGLPLGDELRGAVQGLTGAFESVLVHPSKTQVLFSGFSDGYTFVYDYERGQWSQRSDDEFSISQVVARGRRYTLSALQVSDPEMLRYEDPASVINNPLVLETGWVSMAGLLRFQRLSCLSICGTTLYKGVYSALTVKLEVYGMEAPNTLLQTSSIVLAAQTTINEPWRCEFQMVKQTDTAYKLRITVTPEASKGGNFSITGLLARVGLKKGGPKLAAANRG